MLIVRWVRDYNYLILSGEEKKEALRLIIVQLIVLIHFEQLPRRYTTKGGSTMSAEFCFTAPFSP